MNNKIFIPVKCKVGFNKRIDCYTGKLGYAIYNDGKDWRKEISWNSWRQKDLGEVVFDNKPMEGFVLNKKVGGTNNGWNHRSTYCRVFHPLNFEFEITIENLLYVLENTSSIKGKGLEGKFILGWQGKDLILVPEQAPEYKEMVIFTDLQSLKLTKKDLVPGNIYLTKSMQRVVYIAEGDKYNYKQIKKEKSFYFYNLSQIRSMSIDIANIKLDTGDKIDSGEFNEYYDKFITASTPRKMVIEQYVLESLEDIKKVIRTNDHDYYSKKYESFIKILKGKKEVYKKVTIEKKSDYIRGDKDNGFVTTWIDNYNIYEGLHGRKGVYNKDQLLKTFSSIQELTTEYPIYKYELKDISNYGYRDVIISELLTSGKVYVSTIYDPFIIIAFQTEYSYKLKEDGSYDKNPTGYRLYYTSDHNTYLTLEALVFKHKLKEQYIIK